MLVKQSKIFVAGHKGMVGSAIVRKLEAQQFKNVCTAERSVLDLTNQSAANDFLASEKPDYIVIAAARVGGIHANSSYPAEFVYQNLMIECNLINGAHRIGCNDLLFLGSSCIYPRDSDQPMPESALLTGDLEPTNEAYAIAKITGIKLCEAYNRQHNTEYRSVMPTNLYGPNDNYHPENSHVIPGLIRRFHEAKLANATEVVVWGSGTPKREFLHVDDLADACLHVMQLEKQLCAQHTSERLSHINIGTGVDVTIGELAARVKSVTNYPGKIVFDSSKPDGPPRKLLDVSLIKALGWQAKIELEKGLQSAYEEFRRNDN
jgi:GDP-L-fucose synthase